MAKETTRITVREAAAILGTTPDYIHYHMRRGDLPIGHVMSSGGRGKRKTYMIYRDKVNAFVGKEMA